MDILDFVEAWWLSVQPLLATADVGMVFERCSGDELEDCCTLNLRRGESERNLQVWASGRAELTIVEVGSNIQKRFEDIRNVRELGKSLARMTSIATAGLRTDGAVDQDTAARPALS